MERYQLDNHLSSSFAKNDQFAKEQPKLLSSYVKTLIVLSTKLPFSAVVQIRMTN